MTDSRPRPSTDPRARLIFALDVRTAREAEMLADELSEEVGNFKLGLELFIAEGPPLVRAIAKRRPVFLDLKLHDIPETVERAVATALELEVSMLTVHSLGGAAMLERAARRAEGTGTTILGVTVLTSSDEATLRSIGVEGGVESAVLRLGRLAISSGVGGLVASPLEVKALRESLGAGPTLVIPGIRPAGHVANDDQARAATPGRAVREGADRLVVGRPIRDASDRKSAARSIVQEIADSLRVTSPS